MRLYLIPILIFLFGCSTPQKSRWATTALGVGAGAVIGAATAPADEKKELHSLYWAGLLGLGAAVVSNYYYSDEKSLELLRLENEKLKAQMDFFQKSSETRLLKEAGNRSGTYKVRLYKTDEWRDDGPNNKIHVDQILETVPAGN